MIHVERQVVAAAFLARLDQDGAARMRHALRLQRQDRGQRAEHRIAVVGAAAPGMSMKITGVRPSRRTTSTLAPAIAAVFARAQAENCATTRSMWPCACQSGSNCGDLLGMRM